MKHNNPLTFMSFVFEFQKQLFPTGEQLLADSMALVSSNVAVPSRCSQRFERTSIH